MITLITGIPGMGKTALLVTMLLELEKEGSRPLFVMGIPDLKLEHVVCPPVNEWTEYRASPEDQTLQLAYFTFPPNAILVVDEAQRVYRPRSSASKVPPEVAALETHRHTGLDIILLTQKPKLIDTNVRELVGRHIHIRAGMLGRYLYEWPHIADGESRLDRGDAAKRRFKPPKAAFNYYKSAELHTKHKFRTHQIFFVAVAAAGFLAWQGYNAYQVFDRNMHPDAVTKAEDMPARSGALALASASRGLPLDENKVLFDAMVRTDENNPYSAPIYAKAAPAVVPPKVIGCIATPKQCICYTQQTSTIYIPNDQCRLRAAGQYYDPYQQQQQLGQRPDIQPQQSTLAKTEKPQEETGASQTTVTVPVPFS